MSERGVWKRLGRVTRLVARWMAIVVALVLVGAAVFERVAAWRDGRVLKQVGRSVDIGGRALNIHCVGEGRPTVVFVRDPAWGDQAARDLHRLVENAGPDRPLVLVVHSFGGYVIRLYHHAYPGDVSGLVFVDTALEDAGRIRGMPHRRRPPVPRPIARGLSIVLGRLGMMRVLAVDPGPPLKDWRAEDWDVLARLRRQRNLALADAQVGPESATAEQVRAAGGLEDLPLLVLTQGRGLGGWSDLQRPRRRAWRDAIAAMTGVVPARSASR